MDGVQIFQGYDNTVGGTAAGSANLISGNTNGVFLYGVGATGNLVAGNLIGTDVLGTTAVPNTQDAVFIEGGASANTFGGTVAGASNLISGNTGEGIVLFGANNNLFEGNRIGTDISGTAALGNSDGIRLYSEIGFGIVCTGNTIGGTSPGAGNLISGNVAGIILSGNGSADNIILGNQIGTDVAGSSALPNTGDGVTIDFFASNNTIGGITAAARNVITASPVGHSAVLITDAGTASNVVEGNFIGTNAAGTGSFDTDTGVSMANGTSNNTIGGTAAGSGNVISGSNTGISILNSSANLVEGEPDWHRRYWKRGTPQHHWSWAPIRRGQHNWRHGRGAGNLISGNSVRGITVDGNSPNGGELIEGNRIGVNAAGTAALSNDQGIVLEAPDNTVGGTAVGAGNLISGNAFQGIGIGVGGTDNLIEGNLIGTDAAGTAIMGNGAGVAIGQPGNTVGGSVDGAGNVISGNGFGLYIASSGNLIEGNQIGTGLMGAAAVPNGTGILLVSGAVSDTIGGTVCGAGEPISGNTDVGVRSWIPTTWSRETGSAPTRPVHTPWQTSRGFLWGSGNTIGGSAPGAGNRISGNSVDGIYIFAPDNLVEGNSMGTNARDPPRWRTAARQFRLTPPATRLAAWLPRGQPALGQLVRVIHRRRRQSDRREPDRYGLTGNSGSEIRPRRGYHRHAGQHDRRADGRRAQPHLGQRAWAWSYGATTGQSWPET